MSQQRFKLWRLRLRAVKAALRICSSSGLAATFQGVKHWGGQTPGGETMSRKSGLIIASSLAAVLAASSVVSAQMLPPQPPPVKNGMGQGNEEERAACHPDVTKYCQVQLQVNPNDVLGILGCLQANRAKISKACQTVLASHGQ
jgi:hypothetical protein